MVRDRLNKADAFPLPTDCITEALEIILTGNNSKFNGVHYLQKQMELQLGPKTPVHTPIWHLNQSMTRSTAARHRFSKNYIPTIDFETIAS